MDFHRLIQSLNPLRFFNRERTDGELGERVAAQFLRKQRYKILAQNLRSRLGEVDILAQAPDGRTVVIVEVKTRSLAHAESTNQTDMDISQSLRPEVHVNAQKQKKLASLALQIVRKFKLQNYPIRFDVIGVDLLAHNKHDVRHHIGAFESHI